MSTSAVSTKEHSVVSYIALVIGVVCFFTTFVEPTRIVMVGSLVGDYVTFGLVVIGVIFSIIGLVKKTEKNLLPIISFILSLSFPFYFVLWLILIFTGVWDFAP